jgi:hypothetical protein
MVKKSLRDCREPAQCQDAPNAPARAVEATAIFFNIYKNM